MKNPLVQKFGKSKRWVNWKFETVGGKMTKIPYFSKSKKASSTDSKTWKTFDTAEVDIDNGSNKFDGLGIVFTPEQNLLGIDIDHCLIEKLIVHEQKEQIEKFIKEANTYTEISPSKTGLHLFLEISGKLSLTSNKKSPFEVYTSGRYFTFTGEIYNKPVPVRRVTPEKALELLAIIGYPWNTTAEIAPIKSPIVSALNANQILRKMFASKNGKKLEALYNGDISAYKGDDSNADLSFVSTLAFWTGKDASLMERIWLNSPLGSRKKTQTRKDYRERTIKKAIADCTDVYEAPKNNEKDYEELDLLFTIEFTTEGKKKKFIQNTENICRILRKHADFQGKFRFDEFINRMQIFEKEKWRNQEDVDMINVQTQLSILFSFLSKVSKEMVFDAMFKVSMENKFDSAVDYLTSLHWDGVSRLDTWLTSVYKAPEDTYHIAVASNWLKGLVKRIVEPGCKFDYVMVLFGPQGIKKSTSLSMLVGHDWHLETVGSPDHKDFFDQFRGKVIIEFSEGETLSKSDVKKLKAVVTMQSDTFRPAYGRHTIDYPRRCVFAMTTNQDEFLKDDTGNRRWLPVECKVDANIEWLLANRDQLMAEAFHRVITLKEKTWEFPEEETKAMQEARRIKDPNTDIIAEWYSRLEDHVKQQGITVNRIYREVLNNNMPSYKPLSKWDEMQIGEVLRLGVGLEKRRVMRHGVRMTLWFHPKDPTPVIFDLSEEDKKQKEFSEF